LNKRDSYPGHVPASGVGGVFGVFGVFGPQAMGRGVLRPELAATRFQLARRPPSDGLAPFVDFYWILRWDLRGRGAHEQTILSHPSVNLAFEAGGAGIYGVDRRLFTRSLSGSGRVFGVRFRAGCFRPFWRAPISELTNRVVPAARVFGPEAEETRRAIMRADAFADTSADTLAGTFDHADAVMTEHAEALLLSVRPERDPAAEQAAELVARITGDPALRRVGQLAAASELSERSLQRLFADYVGVSPKWVMRRARLHEAAERADGGEVVDWAGLAADLGYADQAHLTRDFTATIGIPPTHYAAPAGRADPSEPLRRAGPAG
jgi:AraC-like DNA-binding protein